MLRESVANPDLKVRRRIMPMLRQEPEEYPEEDSYWNPPE
jgi:hypothetical protein